MKFYLNISDIYTPSENHFTLLSLVCFVFLPDLIYQKIICLN